MNFKAVGIKVLFKIITLNEIIGKIEKVEQIKRSKMYPVLFYINLKKRERERRLK